MCREQGYDLGRLGYKAAQAQSGVSGNGSDPLRLPHTCTASPACVSAPA